MPEPGAAVRRRRPAHKQKGDAAFRNNDVRAAERWYAAALEEDSEHPALHYNSAACLERLGRPLDTARCCASALRCRSDYAAARLPRARCLAHGAAADGDRGPNAKAYLVEALAEYTKCPEVGAEQTAVARRLKRCNTEDPAADAAAARAYAARARARQPPPQEPKVVGPTLYDVVGAPRGATPAALKRTYRARALRMHPDKSNAPDAEDSSANCRRPTTCSWIRRSGRRTTGRRLVCKLCGFCIL